MEPPGSLVPARRLTPGGEGLSHLLDDHAPTITLAALAAATVVALLSRTDGVVLAILLALGAWEGLAAVTALLVGISLAGRIGTTSLAGLAGAQAVLGPAGVVGPPLAAASGWLGAAALVLACPGGWSAVPFGIAAALLVEGPAATSPARLFVRLIAMVAFVDAAAAAGRWVPRRVALPLAAVLGGAALVTALAGAPAGGFGWRHLITASALAEGALVLAAAVAIAVLGPLVAARLRTKTA